MSSRLQELANQVRHLSAQTGRHMEAIQQASRTSNQAGQRIASSSAGSHQIVSLIESAKNHLDQAATAIGAFGSDAARFADWLARDGGSGSIPTATATLMGAHGALAATSSGGASAYLVVDALTGNELTWPTDSHGRTVSVSGTLQEISGEGRTSPEVSVATKIGHLTKDSGFNDDGGHLAAASIIGSFGPVNIVPQDATLNRGSYNKMEKQWRNLLTSGQSIDFKIEVIYGKGNNIRPTAFMVTWSTSSTPGIIHKQHYSNAPR